MKLFGGKGHNSNDGINTENDRLQKEPEKAPKKAPEKEPKKNNIGKGIVITLTVIALIVVGVVLYWTITTEPPDVESDPTPPVESGSLEVEEPKNSTRYYYTLVVGEDQLQSNTDTIMLVRYDSQENQADILSIPRDTIVNVPWSAKRINAVYYSGEDGIYSLMDEVGRLTGIQPNNYVIINMQVFVEVVDAMGGVWFDVPCDMNYDDYSLDNQGNPYEFTIHVDKGYQKLNGYDAIGVFRFRQNNDGTGYPGGDWERIEVQHDLLMAIAQQALETRNLIKLFDIAASVFGNCTTDLALKHIQWYLQEFYNMSMENLSFYTMPTIGCWVYANAYVTVDADAWTTMLNEHFNTSDTPVKPEDLPLFQARDPMLDRYNLTPSNYYMTNGETPYTNFPKGYIPGS